MSRTDRQPRARQFALLSLQNAERMAAPAQRSAPRSLVTAPLVCTRLVRAHQTPDDRHEIWRAMR